MATTAHKYTSISDQINMTINAYKSSNIIDNTKNSYIIKRTETDWKHIYYGLKSLIKSDWTKEEYNEWRDCWKNSYLELSFEIFLYKHFISVPITEKPMGFVEANYQSLKDRLGNVAEAMMQIKELSKIKSEQAFQLYNNNKMKETI